MGEMKERLVVLITKSGLTQREVALKADVTEAAMSHYLNGTRCPRPVVLGRLAAVLNTTVDYLINGEEEHNDPYNEIKKIAARNVSKLSEEQKYEIIKILMKNG